MTTPTFRSSKKTLDRAKAKAHIDDQLYFIRKFFWLALGRYTPIVFHHLSFKHAQALLRKHADVSSMTPDAAQFELNKQLWPVQTPGMFCFIQVEGAVHPVSGERSPPHSGLHLTDCGVYSDLEAILSVLRCWTRLRKDLLGI